MYYAKTLAKMLQNICQTFLQMFQHVKRMLKIGGGYM